MRKLLLLFLFVPFLHFSQTEFQPPKIVPASPDVSALVKYADLPVTDYNGTMNFSVNLWNLKEGEFQFPLSASYYSNGLKVDEEATSIGLGWSLFAGGVINEYYDLDHINQSVGIVPWGTNVDVNKTDELFYETNQIENKYQVGCSYPDLTGTPITIADNLSLKISGYKHAYYLYNFAGKSGKFIKDREGNFITTNRSNIRFEKTSIGIKATHSDGTVYLFEEEGSSINVRNTSSIPCSPTNNNITDVKKAFYLSKIITVTGREINFVYSQNRIESLPQISEWYTTSNLKNEKAHRVIALSSVIEEKILKEIVTSDTKIKFLTSSRDDMLNAKKIDKIEIYSTTNLNNAIKSIHFSYDYFQGDASYGDFITQERLGCSFINDNTNINTRSLRLKLNSIEFKDSELNSIENYNFIYTTNTVPYKTSRARDLWGYFNGINNNSLIPNVNDLGYYDYTIPQYFYGNPIPIAGNRDRKSNENFMKWGMLKAVIQPTKGVSIIDYEINEFDSPGVTTEITDRQVSVQDLGSGISQKTFTMVFDGYVSINAQISCSSPANNCTNLNDTCPSYIHQGESIGDYDNRLYAIIEKKNSNGNWVLADNSYDRFNNEMQNKTTCALQKQLYLQRGEYRITANYPDNKTGLLGGPWSYLSVTYKHYESSNATIKGAGLRIKKISDYGNDNKLAKEIFYSYNGGKLMGQPIFTYLFNDGTRGAQVFMARSDGSSENCSDAHVPENPIPEYRTIYSNPVIGLSTNASGALVGYDIVSKSNSEINNGGREINKYYNDYPGIFYISSITGISPTDKLKNGLLKEKLLQKKTQTNDYVNVKKEENVYKVNDFKLYWEYVPDDKRKITDPYHEIYSFARGFRDVFMNFSPIQTANTFLKEKKVTEYFYDNNSLTGTVDQKINYEYNNKHQLSIEKTLGSDGNVIENISYYPDDLKNGSRLTEMYDLISLNRIDAPVKNEKYLNSVKVQSQEIFYISDITTNYKLLPKEVYIWGLNPNESDKSKIVYDKYDDKGNLLQYTFNMGAPVSFVWGYNKNLPIAKIEGMQYGAILPNYINSIVEASNADISPTTENNFESALNAFRNNLQNYFVTTYVYDPLIGVKILTAPNGIKTYYNYDSFGRLKEVSDGDKYLIKSYSYNYSNKFTSVNYYLNELKSKYFIKNDCLAGNIGSSYTYTVPNGRYISFISQSEANQFAQDDINANGQNEANLNGICLTSCPLTLSSTFAASSLKSIIGKNNSNHVSLYLQISANYATLFWQQGTIIGTIGSDCKPSTTKVFSYNEPGTDRQWYLTINPVGGVFLQLKSGTLSYPFTVNVEFDK